MVGNWYEVSYKGKKGYVYKSYMPLVPTKITVNPPVNTSNGMYYVVLDDLNMRQSGEGSSVLAVIPNGTSVKSTGKKLKTGTKSFTMGKQVMFIKAILRNIS